jgi:enoyl-CoA hydratase
MVDENLVLCEVHGNVGLVQLNRPRAFNALSLELLTALMDELQAFDQQTDIGAMVIIGSERAFSVGADLKELSLASPIDLLVKAPLDQFDRIRTVHKPVVAAVAGWSLGGGFELALSCDLIVAAETARFGLPELNLGLFPGAGGTQRLVRTIGKHLAMEMILNNRTLTAEEALRLGLVNRVVPVENYRQEALSLAREIASRAPLAVRLAKEAINQALETPLSQGLLDERRLFFLAFASQDSKEGMAAFAEKRTPEWKGV